MHAAEMARHRRELLVAGARQPRHEIEVFFAKVLGSRVGFPVFRRRSLAMSVERHPHAGQCLGGLACLLVVVVAEHSPQREHGFGQPFTHHLAAGDRGEFLVFRAGLFAQAFQFVGGEIHGPGRGRPARTFRAEFGHPSEGVGIEGFGVRARHGRGNGFGRHGGTCDVR
jgi:hypothetical protein